MVAPIITVQNLSRHFGRQSALQDLNFSIQPGYVYGLVGSNGAGKTTLIKHLLGLYRAQSGWVRVFDCDPAKQPVAALSQIGYLSENRDLPEWMRVDELLRYTAAFYPSWDWNYALDLLSDFGLDARKKIKQLSRGGKAQVGLITAVAHRPRLLLLDEPSSGLDPLVRKDILSAIVRIVSEEGRTVIFSSHLLDEIELMSDYLMMLDRGRLLLFDQLDTIKSNNCHVIVRWPNDLPAPRIESAFLIEQTGPLATMILAGEESQIRQRVSDHQGEVIQIRGASLQEVFTAQAGSFKRLTHSAPFSSVETNVAPANSVASTGELP